MEMWIVLAAVAVFILFVVVALIWQSRRDHPARARAEGYYGPLPEEEAERAEPTDPAEFGQVTPGALTPAAAGSSEQYYEATGVGSTGPTHLSGPQPVVTPSSDWDQESDGDGAGRRLVPMALVAGGGGALGLAVFVVLRRRARRRGRVERLRERARRVAEAARDSASGLSENVDPRTAGGSAAALVAALVLGEAFRRRQREAEAERLAAEAAAAAERAARQARRGLKLGGAWLKRRNGAAELRVATDEVRGHLEGSRPVWLLVTGGGLAAVMLAGLVVRRARRQESDWTGAAVADSAPATEPPAGY